MRTFMLGKLLPAAFLVFALGCAGGWEVPSPSGVIAGLEISGSVSKQGVPVNEASAILYPCAYHPPLPYSGTLPDSNAIPLLDTVENGEYSFAPVDTGFYNLIIQDLDGYCVFMESLLVCSNSKTIQFCTLAAPGRVVGAISDSIGPVPDSSMVYLPGTGFFAYTGANGAFEFESIPAGRYDVQMDTSDHWRRPIPDVHSLPLPPNPETKYWLSSSGFSVAPSETSYVIIEK